MAYRNILLIDDDIDDQEIFLTAIQDLPLSIDCIAEGSAETALKKLMEKQVSVDLIFLDLNMPVMNGREFLIAIKKNPELSNIPVIILSTSSNAATIKETRQLGALDFITKPDTYSVLKNILHDIVC
jgi:CheY-like chemotaxis protein